MPSCADVERVLVANALDWLKCSDNAMMRQTPEDLGMPHVGVSLNVLDVNARR